MIGLMQPLCSFNCKPLHVSKCLHLFLLLKFLSLQLTETLSDTLDHPQGWVGFHSTTDNVFPLLVIWISAVYFLA